MKSGLSILFPFSHWIFQLLMIAVGKGVGVRVNVGTRIPNIYRVYASLKGKPWFFLLSVAPELFSPRRKGS